MSEKRYQISPIELVRWAEPLFGFGEGKATGFSEQTIAAYEAAAGVRLPAALREYYLACGKASPEGRFKGEGKKRDKGRGHKRPRPGYNAPQRGSFQGL